MKRWYLIPLVVILLIGAYIFLLSQGKNTQLNSGSNPINHLYFWSETCPHCKNVAAFLETWQFKDQLILDKKEISKDQGNSLLFIKKSEDCGFNKETSGVPLLITPQGKCFQGDTPIIDYLKSLFKESSPSATISATPTL